MQAQTSFETARGIASVSVEPGYSLVVVRNLDENEKLRALEVIDRGQIPIDFLKLGKGQLSFLVKESDQQKAVDCLKETGFTSDHHRSKAIITIVAPNIRDESGLVARIAELAISSEAIIYCVGDMHNSVLVVVQTEKSEAIAALLRSCIGRVDILQ